VQRIAPSALSRKVTSAPRFSVPSGNTQVSRVAICRSQEAHCSGSCLTLGILAAAGAGGALFQARGYHPVLGCRQTGE